MNNEQIIANVAIESGYMEESEVIALIEAGKEIPLHTLMGWDERLKRKGVTCRVRKGEHGIETRLWKKRNKKNKNKEENEEDQDTKREFYLAKAYLFSKEQLEISE